MDRYVPKESKTIIQENMCTRMFIVVLYTIPKLWKQPKFLSIHKQIKKLQYIYTMEYHLAIEEIFSYHL